MKNKSTRNKWFREAGLGMLIHWGVYSAMGRGCWMKAQEKMSDEEYWREASEFNAQKYNPEEWVKIARNAGMNYMVLTTKHHDGYCLFDTKTTQLNSVKLGPEKDLVGAFVNACHKHKMRVGIYFSLPDWSKSAFFEGPDANPAGWKEFIRFTHWQVRELMSNYGKIDILWYDNILGMSGQRTLTAGDYQSEKLNRMVRRLQPDILINDRSLLPEDFYTAEQSIKSPADAKKLWEACITMNKHWAFFPADQQWKTPAEIINLLTGCAFKGGNLLLNVGPRPDGTIPSPNIRNLKALGRWMKIHGEAIYGTEACRIKGGTVGVFTRKGDIFYLIVHWWHGKKLALPEFPYEVKTLSILGSSAKPSFRHEASRLILENLPARAPDKLCSVLKIKVADKEPEADMKNDISINFREQVASK